MSLHLRLITAIRSGNVEDLRAVLDDPDMSTAVLDTPTLASDIDDESSSEEPPLTVLHLCAANNKPRLIEVLVDRGATIDVRTQGTNRTPLHYAAAADSVQSIAALVSRGAKVNAKDREGRTPLISGAMRGAFNGVTALCSMHAKVKPKDSDGMMAMHHAAKMGHAEVIAALLETGRVNIDWRTTEGQSALHLAVRFGHTAVVELLLEEGCDVDAIDNSGATPLIYAASEGLAAVTILLLDNGAHVDGTPPHRERHVPSAVDRNNVPPAVIGGVGAGAQHPHAEDEGATQHQSVPDDDADDDEELQDRLEAFRTEIMRIRNMCQQRMEQTVPDSWKELNGVLLQLWFANHHSVLGYRDFVVRIEKAISAWPEGPSTDGLVSEVESRYQKQWETFEAKHAKENDDGTLMEPDTPHFSHKRTSFLDRITVAVAPRLEGEQLQCAVQHLPKTLTVVMRRTALKCVLFDPLPIPGNPGGAYCCDMCNCGDMMIGYQAVFDDQRSSVVYYEGQDGFDICTACAIYYWRLAMKELNDFLGTPHTSSWISYCRSFCDHCRIHLIDELYDEEDGVLSLLIGLSPRGASLCAWFGYDGSSKAERRRLNQPRFEGCGSAESDEDYVTISRHKKGSVFTTNRERLSRQNTGPSSPITNDPSVSATTHTCSICLDDLDFESIDVIETMCGHHFHSRCLKEALQVPPRLCPMCRSSNPLGDEFEDDDDDEDLIGKKGASPAVLQELKEAKQRHLDEAIDRVCAANVLRMDIRLPRNPRDASCMEECVVSCDDDPDEPPSSHADDGTNVPATHSGNSSLPCQVFIGCLLAPEGRYDNPTDIGSVFRIPLPEEYTAFGPSKKKSSPKVNSLDGRRRRKPESPTGDRKKKKRQEEKRKQNSPEQ